jgi:Protein of unknown function (DUF2752).
MDTKQRKIRVTFLIGAILIFLLIYFLFNPQHSIFFPKCPFCTLTGLQCPGCGSQRAIHCLLHLDFVQAFNYNALLVMAIPYLGLGIYFEYFNGKVKYPMFRNILFGEKACYALLIVIFLFFIIRNFLI